MIKEFELISARSHSKRVDVIMFEDLSDFAKAKALEYAEISRAEQRHWDVLPIAYTHCGMNLESQESIDDEALSQIGYYRHRCA